MTELPRLDHGMPADLRAAIGELVVEFQALEMHLRNLAVVLVPAPQRIGQILTAELSFKQLCRLARSLYWELHGPSTGLEHLDELLKKAQRCVDERNHIVHSVWTFNYRHKTTAKGKVEFKGEAHADDKQLRTAAAACNSLASEVFHFHLNLARTGRDGASMMQSYEAGRYDRAAKPVRTKSPRK